MACAAQVSGSHSGRHASVIFTSLDLVSLPKDGPERSKGPGFEWESPGVNPWSKPWSKLLAMLPRPFRTRNGNHLLAR
jgi:hypothetical protein